ncbi:MAG: hypothetical protein ACOYM9_05305 [Bradymonadia bacterium]
MKFWDSAAVVQLLVEPPGSAALRALLGVERTQNSHARPTLPAKVSAAGRRVAAVH